MSDQTNGGQNVELPGTIRELLERIDRSFIRLDHYVRSLTSEQLTVPGPSGWSVKDHLAHLAVWERGVVDLLNGRDRFAAMQVEEAANQGKSVDEINDQIYHRNQALTLTEALDLFRGTHLDMVRTLEKMEDAGLTRPYTAYLPESGRSDTQRPVIFAIINNTYEHFDEHYGWIQTQVQMNG